jgi:rare lipoprotein A
LRLRRAALVAGSLALGACTSLEERPAPSSPQVVRPLPAKPAPPPSSSRYSLQDDIGPEPGEIPPDLLAIPDAVPRAEPRSRGGNSPQYTVFGKTYRVMDEAKGYRERGGASWYGRKFHGHLTANGERYDMYAMTAAHKSLPLPSFVRVTHLGNGKSVVVRVNDRGPFHKGRIIDLSYAAAARLDMLGAGTAEVEVEAIVPGEPLHRPPHRDDPEAPGYLQVASFADPINAVNLREDLISANLGPTAIWIDEESEIAWHRVVIGPFSREADTRRARELLQQRGHSPRWVRP